MIEAAEKQKSEGSWLGAALLAITARSPVVADLFGEPLGGYSRAPQVGAHHLHGSRRSPGQRDSHGSNLPALCVDFMTRTRNIGLFRRLQRADQGLFLDRHSGLPAL